MTYASSAMWNWHLLNPKEPISLDNIVMTYTYSGSTDEMWFYLISVQIEHFGGKALDNMIKAIQAAQNWDLEGLSKNLAAIADAITNINKTLIKMHEKCDPYVFYWKVRPYLAGWENMQNAGLPHGIIYEGVDCPAPVTNPEEVPPSKYRQYAGGSAGQSSLIQALDVFLGVNHYPTSSEWREWKKNPELYNPSKHVNYLMKIRDYMPNAHRQFLYDLKAAFDIRAFIEELKNNDVSPIAQEVLDNYNLAVGNIKEFRDKHISIVTRFIILPAKKGPFLGSYNVGVTAEQPPAPEQVKASQESIQKSLLQNNTSAKASTSTETQSGSMQSRSVTGGDILYPQRTPHTLESTIQRINQLEIKKKVDSNHGIAKQVSDDDIVRGTGGTDLIPFLKQARDETTDTQLS
jgi:indoleamine 2,3-dioxygenase